jgi:hypothetical protein
LLGHHDADSPLANVGWGNRAATRVHAVIEGERNS